MKTFKLILLLALVFLAGIVVGVVGTRAVVRGIVREVVLHPEKIQTVVERRLTRQLHLDNEQQVKLHGILTDTHGQLRDLRSQYAPQILLLLSNANEQITDILTPEQQAQFEKIRERNQWLTQALKQGEEKP
jgi:hypothetical protein